MSTRETVYIAVRKDTTTNAEWVDLATIAYDRQAAHSKAARCPESRAWKERNPLVRVSSFVITETK